MNKTIGAISSELLQKDIEKVLVNEKSAEMQQDYMKNLFEAVDRGYVRYLGDFFIEVTTKLEPLMKNVLRNYFADRLSCPTPNYDQTVFRYNRGLGQIEYLWSLPCRDAAHHLKDNKNIVAQDEQQLLGFVMAMDNGKLLQLCKKWNGEMEDSTLLKG